MSWFEYSDMFDIAQIKKSNKIMIIIDVKNSRTNPKYIVERNNIFELMNDLTEKYPYELLKENEILYKTGYNYFCLGDLFGINIKSNDLKAAQKAFISLFKELKIEYGITLDFHFNIAYYETDDYGLGDRLYYSGYCVQELEHRSKLTNILL